MRAAAEAGDAAAFAAYVDFPALREDMKAELTPLLAAEAGRRGGPAAGLFGAALAGPVIDALVSPEGLSAAFVAGAAASAAAPPARALQVGEDPFVTRRGLSEFLLSPRDRPGTGLVFTRRGLAWRLSGIELAGGAQ